MTVTDHRPVMAITGGASGIGFATARLWVERGGTAVLLDFNEAVLQASLEQLGEHARGVVTNVTDRTSVDAAFASIRETEGRLDALVNCAGNSRPVPSATLTDEDWEALIAVHLSGSMRTCRAAYPLLAAQDTGAIVNLSSVAGKTGMPQRASYTTAKAGLDGLTRTLAVEWAQDSIRVNAVGPGYTRTPFTDQLITEGKLDPAPIEARVPMRRFAEPHEIAEAIVFLCAPGSSYITGHTLMVDGGMTIDGNWYQ
ncbi:SDR family oxidoreductase (plasmid) [Citricoccus nitrophenolicus]